MIKKYTTEEEIKEGAKVVLKHRLHNTFGAMRGWCIELDSIESVYIYFINAVPIAAMILRKFGNYNIGVFVNEQHRKMGYGSKLMNELSYAERYNLRVCKYNEASTGFYNKTIPCTTP
tara:strand:+ start:36 stop:389 length:354 start_codon:yes stop_codon:yes gene_type:complete